MLQDIAPHRYEVEFSDRRPRADDALISLHNGALLIQEEGGYFAFPEYAAFEEFLSPEDEAPAYLFSVDGKGFFLAPRELPLLPGFIAAAPDRFRELKPAWLAFAGLTALHLARWHAMHRFCGSCGSPMQWKRDERARCCTVCGGVAYPGIAPAVIVGVVDGDRLLLTRYAAGNYRRHALVAGFVEVGETLEDTVRREVMEETGLKVKNVRYYKSQPWGLSQSLLVGFFGDLEGSGAVDLSSGELSEAIWVPRCEVPAEGSEFSLTREMMRAFRSAEV